MSEKVNSDQKFEGFSEWFDKILLEAQIATTSPCSSPW